MKTNRLTKDVKRQLRRLAKDLPPLVHKKRTQRIRISGNEILKQNPKALDNESKPISGSKTYIETIPMPVNHEKELESIFINYGFEGVETYIKEAKEMTIDDVPKMKVLPIN